MLVRGLLQNSDVKRRWKGVPRCLVGFAQGSGPCKPGVS
jgi:hypothetical protein